MESVLTVEQRPVSRDRIERLFLLPFMCFALGCPHDPPRIPMSPPPLQQQPETDVCSLLQNPSAFTGRMVRLQAFVDSDLIESTMLTQDGCRGGVALDTGKSGNRPVALIEDADYQQYSRLRLKFLELSDTQQRVQGVFEGLFILRQNASPAGILYLHKVSDLQIKPVGAITPTH